MDRRSSDIGIPHSQYLNSTSVHGSQTSEEQTAHGLGSVQLPNKLLQGDRPITTPIGDREISRVEVDTPSIPKPHSMICRASARPVSQVSEHTLFRLRESIRPETVETADRKTRLQMAERVGRLHDALGWRFKMPANRQQLETSLNGNNGHLMTLAMAQSMLHQIEVRETGVADAIIASGQSKEAWTKGLLQRYELEKMHREVLALAEFYCQHSPELTNPEEIISPSENDPFLDHIFAGNSLAMPPLVPTLATPRPPDGPVLSTRSFQLSRAQQELRCLREEKEELGTELQQTRNQLTELKEEVEALKHKEKKVPERFSKRLSELEKEQAELKDELNERDRQLREEQHRIVSTHGSAVGSRELLGADPLDSDARLDELEALNSQLQARMNEQTRMLADNGVTMSELQKQLVGSGQKIDVLQSQLQAAHLNHQQMGQQAVSALEQKDQLVLQLRQEYLDSYQSLENELDQERARLAELQQSYQHAQERVADLFRQNGLLHIDIKALDKDLEALKQADSARVAELETQVKELTRYRDRWVLAHVDVTGKKRQVEEKAKQLEEQLNLIEENHKQKLDQLQRKFEEADSRAHSAEQSLFALEGDYKGALAREEDLNKALTDTKRDLLEKVEELEKRQSEFELKAQSLKEIHLERQKYDDEIKGLQQTLVEQKNQAQEEKAKLEALLLTNQAELEALQLKYEQDLKGLEALNEQLDNARAEITSLKEQLQSLQLDQSKGSQESPSHETEIAQIAEQLRVAEQKHQKEKADLESEVESARISEQRVETQLTDKERELNELQSRLESTEHELREKIVSLENDLRSKEDDLSQRDQALAIERRKVQELTVQSDGLEEEKDKLESSLAALREELETAERTTRSSKEEVTEYIRQLQAAENNAEKLQRKFEEAKRQEREARERSAIADESIPKLQETSERYHRELQLSEQEVNRLKDLLTDKEDELAEAKIRENSLSSSILTKDDRIRELEEAEVEFRREIEKANQRAQEKQQTVVGLSQNVDDQVRAIEKLTHRIQQLIPEKELSDNKVIELEERVQLIAQERDEAKQILLKAEKNLRSGSDAAEIEKKQWENQLRDSRSRVSDLESRLKETEKKRDHFQSESDAFAYDRDQVKKQLQELQLSAESLKSQHTLEMERLTRERDEFKLQVETLEQKAEVASADWDKEKVRIEEAREKLFADLKSQHDQLVETKQRLDQQLLASQEEVRKTKLELSHKDAILEQKEQNEHEFRREIEKAKQRTQEKQQTVAELSQDVDDKVRTIEKLTHRVQQLIPQKELSDSKVIELEESVRLIEQERDEAKQMLLKAEKNLRSGSDAAEIEKAQWENQLRDSRSRVSDLESRLKETEKKRDHFQSESDALAYDRDQVKKQLQGLQLSAESLKSQHTLEMERLTRERDEFKLQVETLEQKAEVASADWDKEKVRIEEAREKLFADLKSQHDQLVETKQRLDQQLLASQEEVRKTKLELSHKDATLEQKEQNIERVNNQLMALKNSLGESQTRVLTLEGEATELGTQYGRLELEVKTLTQEKDQAHTAFLKQNEELNLLRGSLEEAETTLESLKRQLNDEQSEKSLESADLKRQIRLAEENRDHFKSLSETAGEQRKILDTRVSELEALLRSRQKEVHSLKGEVDDLGVRQERALKEAQGRSSQLEKDLAFQESRHKHEALGWEEERQRLTSSQEEIVVGLKEQLQKLQHLKNDVDSRVSKLELEGKTKDLELQQKSLGLEERKEEVSRLQSEAESLKAELKSLTDQSREAASNHTLALKEKELAHQKLAESLEKEQRQRDQEKIKLEEAVSDLEQERNALQSKLTVLQAVSIENQTLSTEVLHLKDELHITQEELYKVREKKREVEQQSEEALKAKASLQSQLEVEQERVETLSERKSNLEAQVHEKERALILKSEELVEANESLERESERVTQLTLQVFSHQGDSGYESDSVSTDGFSEAESFTSTAYSDPLPDRLDSSADEAFDLTLGSPLPKWTDLGAVVSEIKSEEFAYPGPETFVISGLIQKMSSAWSELASRQELTEKEREIYHFTGPDDFPGRSGSRKEVMSLHEQFLMELESIDQAYQKALGATPDRPFVDEFTRRIDRTISLTRGNIQVLARKQEDFQAQVNRFEASLEALKPDTLAGPEDPEAIVDSELSNMSTLLAQSSGDLDREFYTHALCVLARSASKRLNESWKQKIATIKEPDEGHRLLKHYEYSLQRLASEHLPPSLRRSVPEHGRVFLSKLAECQKAELEARLDQQLGGGHKPQAGHSLEEQMVRDPQICDRLLTLLSSLREQHEGIIKQPGPANLAAGATQWVDFSYADASLVGLSQIRDEFGLPATPTMTKVLRTLQKELKRPGSLVLTMAVKQHKENYETGKERDTRRHKLERQCSELLAQETRLDPKQKFRGLTHDHDFTRAVEHPHQAEIACFQPDSPVPLAEASGHVQTQAGFRVSALTQNPDCLINSFMNGFNKIALHKTSLVTGDRYIELSEGAQCRPSLVFHSKKGQHWQIQLDGRTWSLDPAFLHEHPNFEVPFQVSTEGREKKRDWIPLKSASGQTVLLVAQKTPSDQQCFMYELGSNHQLIPVPIRGENPRGELIKANLLSKACLLKPDSTSPSRARKDYPPEVLELESLKNTWLPNASLEQIDECYKKVVEEVDHQLLKPPFTCTPCEGRVRSLPVELPVVRKVAQEKSRKPETGAHQETFHPEQFSVFTVNASFGHVSEAFLKARRELLDDSAHSVTKGVTESVIKTLEGEQKAFQEQVFKNLSVYSGCELQTRGPRGMPGPKALKINRQSVLSHFEKVMVNNRKHCVRTLQLKKALEKGLVSYIRNASESDLQAFSDGELLDHAIRNFEKGLAPGGNDVDGFIKRMSQLMLVDIDLEQSSLISQRLEALKSELVDLDFAALEQVSEPHEYIRRCQEWNLDMALLASRQSNLNNRISSYENTLLDTKNLALLSFERRHHIVLSPDQADELAVTLDGVSQWANGHEVAMMSHKGTGYGKSTLLLALTDHASAQLGADTDRSVIVMAPKTNQAELDKGLREYYAHKGQDYRRLNLETCFAPPCELSVARLVEVENTLLGLPAGTAISDRESLLTQGRVPVGASITDVQILMHLKQALLDAEGFIQDKQAILAKLDACLDLLKNSMVFADEFDSEMVPHTEAESISVAQTVQALIRGLGYAFEVEPRSINLKHSEFLFGCKARHLLSATLGTVYCAALASASGSAEEVRHKARTDPVTTNQRFWHFISLAEPVFFSSSDPEGRNKMLTDVLHRVGPEPQIIFFDGAEPGDECTTKAHQMSRILNQERLAMGGVQKSVIYYDHDKNLQMQYQDDPVYGQGASASREAITQLRRMGGQSTDGYLSKAQSVGTDMPQGSASVGIFHGLVGQAGGEANENYLVQQLGRLTRDSKDLHKAQRVFMAVDLDAVKDIKGADEQKEAFAQALNALDESMQAEENLFPEGIDNASSALKKVVEQTVTFPVQKSEEGESGYLQSLPQIRAQLAEMAKKEWAELGLSPEAFQELIELKVRQWVCKNAWLELVAVDIASREKSHHTLSCEKELMQARTNSHLDRVYAAEHHWLNDEAVSLVDGLDLKAAGIPTEAVPVVTRTLKSEVTRFLKSTERRFVLPGTYQEDLLETADAKPMRERLSGYFKQLKSEGIKLDGKDMVSETNKKLIRESDAALEEALTRITELHNVVKSLNDKALGAKLFEDIMASLQASRRKLSGGGGAREAMQTEATIRRAYSDMMKAVMKVIVYQIKRADLEALEKRMMAVITQCVDLDSTLRLSLYKNPVGPDVIKAMGFGRLKEFAANPQKFRWRRKGPQGQWTLIGNTSQNVMDCDKAEGHFKIKDGYISNKAQLNSLQTQAASLSKRQAELDRAVKLCQHPVKNEFKDCVDEVERALMQQFDAFAREQKKITEREQELMLKQSELRQSKLYKVLV
ncbi:hypothetical protein [Endozoicomonas sp. 8E]|uniref:hypothetical protein n=1 Tax=Endozoicomonas sp. 8E TaxID=3035692 RepID=UPI002938E085|nr:hypothetical protein [Endozoicomonas sp. 8E]WOG26479.1 hypothetical protein P6910_18290 [Endozoicomonas sp. 8E]